MVLARESVRVTTDKEKGPFYLMPAVLSKATRSQCTQEKTSKIHALTIDIRAKPLVYLS